MDSDTEQRDDVRRRAQRKGLSTVPVDVRELARQTEQQPIRRQPKVVDRDVERMRRTANSSMSLEDLQAMASQTEAASGGARGRGYKGRRVNTATQQFSLEDLQRMAREGMDTETVPPKSPRSGAGSGSPRDPDGHGDAAEASPGGSVVEAGPTTPE